MAVSLPGVPDQDPGADGPRPFDRSSLEQSLADVLRAANPELAAAPVPLPAGSETLTIPTGVPKAPPPSDVRAGGAGRPDPFRAAGSVNHVGLRLPPPRPDTPDLPSAGRAGVETTDAAGATAQAGALTPGATIPDPPGGALRPGSAIPPNLRLLAPPPDAAVNHEVAAASDAVAGIAGDGSDPTGSVTAQVHAAGNPVVPWRPEDDDILPQRRGRRRRGH